MTPVAIVVFLGGLIISWYYSIEHVQSRRKQYGAIVKSAIIYKTSRDQLGSHIYYYFVYMGKEYSDGGWKSDGLQKGDTILVITTNDPAAKYNWNIYKRFPSSEEKQKGIDGYFLPPEHFQ